MGGEQIHWFSIVNSLMIVLFLTGMVAMIMMRTLHRDFNRYNQQEATDDVEEETGWKLVHGDVFRPPRLPMMLSVLVGTGVQTFTMTFITMIFAVLGFLSPANRGGLLTAALLLFVFMGVPAGYCSAFLHKTLKGVDWKKNIVLTSCMLPGTVFFVMPSPSHFPWCHAARSSPSHFPWCHAAGLLHPQLFHLGREVVLGRALRHDVRAARAVARHLRAPRLPRRLLWVSSQECAHTPPPTPAFATASLKIPEILQPQPLLPRR